MSASPKRHERSRRNSVGHHGNASLPHRPRLAQTSTAAKPSQPHASEKLKRNRFSLETVRDYMSNRSLLGFTVLYWAFAGLVTINPEWLPNLDSEQKIDIALIFFNALAAAWVGVGVTLDRKEREEFKHLAKGGEGRNASHAGPSSDADRIAALEAAVGKIAKAIVSSSKTCGQGVTLLVFVTLLGVARQFAGPWLEERPAGLAHPQHAPTEAQAKPIRILPPEASR